MTNHFFVFATFVITNERKFLINQALPSAGLSAYTAQALATGRYPLQSLTQGN
jgi:hypothetical protein